MSDYEDAIARIAKMTEAVTALVNSLMEEAETLRPIRTSRGEAVISSVLKWSAIPRNILMSECRTQPVANARMIAYWACGELGLSHSQIGRLFKRDSTSVTHGIRKIKKRRLVDTFYREETDFILQVARAQLIGHG